jgi:hypothetical protein
MKLTDGLQNFGPELLLRLKIFETEAGKIHPAARKAVEFCNNYINMNKAIFGSDFLANKFEPGKKYTITVVCEIFPVLYIHMLNRFFSDSKIYVITKQYTTHKLQPLFWKYFPNVELVDKRPMFDKEIEWHFDQSDFVFIPDSDYLMPFELLDHFKFKNCLVLNFKDPHERKTNNNLAYSADHLLELCDFSKSHEHYTHKIASSGNSFFNNNRIFYAYGDRLYGK